MSHLIRSANTARPRRQFVPVPSAPHFFATRAGDETAAAFSCPAETARALIGALSARDWQGAGRFLTDDVMIAGALGDASGRRAVLASVRNHLPRDALPLQIRAMDVIDGSVIARAGRLRLVLEYNAAGAVEAITVSRAPGRGR